MRTEAPHHPDLLDARATVTVLVAAGVLSLLRFTGRDLDALILDYRAWPQEPWRLVTTTLLHGNELHLVFNLLMMWQLGRVVEWILGLSATIVLYLVLAVGSSAAQWALSGPAIGLSGVVYGLWGFLWAMDRWHPAFHGALNPNLTKTLVVWFFLCIATTWTGILRVANVAHGAGAVLGGVAGWTLCAPVGRRLARVWVLPALLLVLALASTVLRPSINWSSARAQELHEDGLVAFEDEDYPKAAELWRGACARAGSVSTYRYNLALAYWRMGRLRDARESMRKALELAPDDRKIQDALDTLESF